MWNENGNILYKTSEDFINWKKKYILNEKNVEITLYNYVNNDLRNRTSKINNIYLSSKFSSSNMVLTNSSDTDTNSLIMMNTKNNIDNTLVNTVSNKSNKTILYENSQINPIIFERIRKNKIIIQLLKKNLILQKELQSLCTSIDEYKYTLNKQKSEHYLEIQKFKTEINTCKNKIHNLKEEKYKLYIEANKKNHELFKIIEEKEKLLQAL
jgi:hypothetical protein